MITSKELFLNNIKDIPPKNSIYYEDFWGNEAHKAEYGLTIDGVYISPWLYWHTQLWNIFIDMIDPVNAVSKRKSMKASFRDNEWLISDALVKAQKDKKGIMLFGSRRLGKSEFIASYIGQAATLYEGSENVVMGGNWGDIDVVMGKIVHGLNKLPDPFKFGRLSENLRKEIELGYKEKDGTRQSWSKIICRNHENGNKTESPAGLTPTTFIMDEVGKSNFASVFEAAKPSFTSPFGWRCCPILTGTSGDIKGNSDAQVYFESPEANNFIYVELEEEAQKKTSIFINGLYRMEGKVESSIGNFVKNEKGIYLNEDSILFDIPMLVKDDEKALAVINEERRQASISPDPTALLKAQMYYPLNTRELFLKNDGNTFPIEAMKKHLAYLESRPELQGESVYLYRDVDNKIKFKSELKKKPILEFPLKDFTGYKKDAPVILYERPIENPPAYLYIAGCDPYNQSSSKWSKSLGSIYIYKRTYDPIGGTFQDRIVAEYTARPNMMREFHETVEMLLELYNAVCMPENEASTFIQYFDLKNKNHMLADGYSLLKELSPNTSITGRNKGLPATTKVQTHYKELVWQYLHKEIEIGKDKEGNPIKQLGLVRIPSIGLLKELIAYNNEDNFDRYVAFGHTLAHEVWADKVYPIITLRNIKEPPKENKIELRNPFGLQGDLIRSNPFGGASKNPFGL